VRLSSSTTSPGADPEDPSGDKGEAEVSKAATEIEGRKQATEKENRLLMLLHFSNREHFFAKHGGKI
jgi:hypothetical protein